MNKSKNQQAKFSLKMGEYFVNIDIFKSMCTVAFLLFASENSLAIDTPKADAKKANAITRPCLKRKAKDMTQAKEANKSEESGKEKERAAWAKEADKLYEKGNYQEAARCYKLATSSPSLMLTSHDQCIYFRCKCYIELFHKTKDLREKKSHIKRAEIIFKKFILENKDEALDEFSLLNEVAIGLSLMAEIQKKSDAALAFNYIKKWFTLIERNRKLFEEDAFFLDIVRDIRALVAESREQINNDNERNNVDKMSRFIKTLDKLLSENPVLQIRQAIVVTDEEMREGLEPLDVIQDQQEEPNAAPYKRRKLDASLLSRQGH
jgi:hypothetical protein